MEKIKEKFNPLVSIIIPVYNGANYMREAIDSALAQTYKNIEVVVVNDGSSDDTDEIAKSYGDKIRYFKKENGGVATALNLAIKKSKGEYISWLSHDDMYYPDKIGSQIDFLNSREDKIAIIFGDVTLISAKGDIIEDKIMSKRCRDSLRCLLAIDLDNTLNGCTLLIPKILFDKFGFFNTDKKYTQDYSMWFNFVENGIPFFYIDKLLVFSRQHNSQGGKIDPSGATIESDQLHSDLLINITDEEIFKYSDYSVDFLIKIHDVYKSSGYTKTSFIILRNILRLSILQKKENKLINVLNSAIYLFPDENSVKFSLKSQLKVLILKKKIKKRVLIYSNVWTRGGVERVMTILSDYLVDFYDIVLVSGDKEFEKKFELNHNVTHIKISENNQDDITNRLGALIVLLDIDLFIGNPNLILNFLDIYKLLNELNIKSIACNHGSYFLPFWSPWLYSVFEKRSLAYKYANVSTWLTTFNANVYKQLNENCAYMPNPNTFKVKPDLLLQKKEKIILCVGRFYDSIKRLDRVLLVFKKVLKDHPDAKLVLVGDYDPNVKIPSDADLNIGEFLSNLNIPTDCIRFEGEQERIDKYYMDASLLLLASDSEGFGMVLIEAGFFGLPSVIFKVVGLEDIIVDGENGFIVEQDDISSMADKVGELLSDNNTRFEMGKKAQELVERFDQEKICKRWKQLINVVLNTDNQENLNAELSKIFMNPVADINKFTKQLSFEYEKNIKLLINNTLSLNRESEIQVSANEKHMISMRDWMIGQIYRVPILGRSFVTLYFYVKKIILKLLSLKTEIKLVGLCLQYRIKFLSDRLLKRNKKKIILFVAMLDSIHTARWLSQFSKQANFEIHVFPSTSGAVHSLIRENTNIVVHDFVGNLDRRFNKINRILERVIKCLKPEIVHTLEMQNAAYKILPIKLKMKNKFPLWFYSCWGSDIRWYEKFPDHRQKITQVLSKCDALFCEDQDNIDKAVQTYGFDGSILKVPAPGGIHVDYYNNKFKKVSTSERKYILVKGYTGWVYKPETVFEAIKLCSDEIIKNGLKIVIYLPGEIDKYVFEMKSLGLDVELFNATEDYDKVMNLFAGAKINIAASLSDGIPNSMLESMLMGAFPIQSFSPGATEFIVNGKNGYLLDCLDVDSYAKTIKRVISDDKLLNEAAVYNAKIIKQKLDYNLVRNKVLNFYKTYLLK